jgi:hypothetical protein
VPELPATPPVLVPPLLVAGDPPEWLGVAAPPVLELPLAAGCDTVPPVGALGDAPPLLGLAENAPPVAVTAGGVLGDDGVSLLLPHAKSISEIKTGTFRGMGIINRKSCSVMPVNLPADRRRGPSSRKALKSSVRREAGPPAAT